MLISSNLLSALPFPSNERLPGEVFTRVTTLKFRSLPLAFSVNSMFSSDSSCGPNTKSGVPMRMKSCKSCMLILKLVMSTLISASPYSEKSEISPLIVKAVWFPYLAVRFLISACGIFPVKSASKEKGLLRCVN